MIDYFSRYVEVKCLKEIGAVDVISSLTEVFARLGIPDKLQSDNGPQFSAKEFKAFCEASGIILVYSPPYFPRVNGEVERQMRSIKKAVVVALNTGESWKEALQRYLFSYRTTPHPVTGKTPAFLLLNRELKDKLPPTPFYPLVDLELHDRDRSAKLKGKEEAERRHKPRVSDIAVGDSVLVKRLVKKSKFDSNFDPNPCKVVAVKGPEATVEASSGKRYRRVKNHLHKVDVAASSDENVVDSSVTRDAVTSGASDGSDSEGDVMQAASPVPEVAVSGDESDFLGFQAEEIGMGNEPLVTSTPLPGRHGRKKLLPRKFLDFDMGD